MAKLFHVAGGVAAGVLALSGCSPTSPRGFESPDPQERARAGLIAAENGDRTRVAELIDLLQDDDAAARLAAIGGLRRLTGHDFGYDYLGTGPERAAAVDRWKAWLGSEEGMLFAGRGEKKGNPGSVSKQAGKASQSTTDTGVKQSEPGR